MSQIIIDPPGGWRYGFPKPIPVDQLGRAREWLAENGYPQSEIDALGDQFYYRSWSIEDPKPQPLPEPWYHRLLPWWLKPKRNPDA
jgi:hypothetical protein